MRHELHSQVRPRVRRARMHRTGSRFIANNGARLRVQLSNGVRVKPKLCAFDARLRLSLSFFFFFTPIYKHTNAELYRRRWSGMQKRSLICGRKMSHNHEWNIITRCFFPPPSIPPPNSPPTPMLFFTNMGLIFARARYFREFYEERV